MWSRCSKASIIEFSKWVRRHQVTKAFGSPVHRLAFRNGAATSRRPPCMSTTVPYWSNMQSLIEDFSVAIGVIGGFRWTRHGFGHDGMGRGGGYLTEE